MLEEHRGRRLPTGLKVSEMCLQYADEVEKFYSYDWRTDSKVIITHSQLFILFRTDSGLHLQIYIYTHLVHSFGAYLYPSVLLEMERYK